jgi:hypothetical protein
VAPTKEPDKEPEITCSICRRPISMEDPKIDDKGVPAHHECYIHEMLMKSWLRAHWE